MEVILREDVTGLGMIGDVVKVKPGFARNFLLPQGLAVLADPRNLGQLEHDKRIIAAKKARERGAIEGRAAELHGLVLETEVRAGKGGRLFGSVTNQDVKRLLDEKGFDVDRRRIELREPIKAIGEFSVPLRVGQDVVATLKLIIKPLGGQLEDKGDDADEVAAAPVPMPESDAETAAETEEGETEEPGA
jgi:large subunit ribosomal protein L9